MMSSEALIFKGIYATFRPGLITQESARKSSWNNVQLIFAGFPFHNCVNRACSTVECRPTFKVKKLPIKVMMSQKQACGDLENVELIVQYFYSSHATGTYSEEEYEISVRRSILTIPRPTDRRPATDDRLPTNDLTFAKIKMAIYPQGVVRST